LNENLQRDLELILKEIRDHNENKFTGEMSLTLKMNQGGIAHISVYSRKDLRKSM